MKNTDLVNAFKEVCVLARPVQGTVTMSRTDSESKYVYGAFAKCCQDVFLRLHLNEMNGQAERYFGIVINMTRALLKISVLDDAY